MNLNIAIVGNPNSGLTTLFNQMTAGVQHIGHFSSYSVTKEGPITNHKGINIVELPGIYSLSAYSKEDISTREILVKGRPDVIINIIDTSSIERNLYLTLQLMELEIPIIIALNMMDEIRKNNVHIDIQKLQQRLMVPLVPISAKKGEGLNELIDSSITLAKHNIKPAKLNFYTGKVHTALRSVSDLIEIYAKNAGLPLNYVSSRVLEGDELIMCELGLPNLVKKTISHVIEDLELRIETNCESVLAEMRYNFIESVCRGAVIKHGIGKEHLRSLRIDGILTHKYLGLPIFFGIMFLVFWMTFGVIGSFLSDLLFIVVDGFTSYVDGLLVQLGIPSPLHALIIEGIFAGVGSVISFLPIIAVLFFFLSILEDSGYMPRVAFVMDKLLRNLGLSGRSIVPMLIGFGCSVPAILTARDLPSKRDRHMTTILVPFMSCSAKLPIYAMFIAAFFVKYEAIAMIGLYATGITVSIVCALFLKDTIFTGEPVPFVMVLPNYRMPAAKSVCLRMWENVRGFIKKAFTVIFVATIIIWALQSFDFNFNMVESSDSSILADIGKITSPIFAPLGFDDWRASTALITGLSAKEAVVSTLAVLTGASDPTSLSAMLNTIFTPLSAYAFLVFCLLYMPCIATLATIRRELGGIKAALIVALFQITVAYIVSYLVYNIGSLVL